MGFKVGDKVEVLCVDVVEMHKRLTMSRGDFNKFFENLKRDKQGVVRILDIDEHDSVLTYTLKLKDGGRFWVSEKDLVLAVSNNE